MKVQHILFGITLSLLPLLAWAQPLNNECLGAQPLNNVSNYCSPPGAFTTVGATVSSPLSPSCFPPGLAGDVWFSFVAQATDVSITVIGNTPPIPAARWKILNLSSMRATVPTLPRSSAPQMGSTPISQNPLQGRW
ncbi:MAG: hypothetical protein IPL49_02430 [Saprospirales bacterium]|nr:hypothetical protein [Saprospirales bacterium]